MSKYYFFILGIFFASCEREQSFPIAEENKPLLHVNDTIVYSSNSEIKDTFIISKVYNNWRNSDKIYHYEYYRISINKLNIDTLFGINKITIYVEYDLAEVYWDDSSTVFYGKIDLNSDNNIIYNYNTNGEITKYGYKVNNYFDGFNGVENPQYVEYFNYSLKDGIVSYKRINGDIFNILHK